MSESSAELLRTRSVSRTPTFYEFFAGGGMVRAGLGAGWNCCFANDFDAGKASAYRANWGDRDLHVGDVHNLGTRDLPGRAELAWASFPCQDLSLAGRGDGLRGARSGTYHAFWDLMDGLVAEARPPTVVAVENVCGALTSSGGGDFARMVERFDAAGYRCGALVIDARAFLPQSRPRLFVIGLHRSVPADAERICGEPHGPFHPPSLRAAAENLPERLRREWVWWRVPTPRSPTRKLADLLECNPSTGWHDRITTDRLLALMSPLNLAKLEAVRSLGDGGVGCVYRRTRRDKQGRRRQRAEVRFDEISGCLRTPAGGSSRQTLLFVDADEVRSRLMSPRETARLMGLPEDYVLPANANAAYALTGDGVATPVVAHLARELFEPLTGLSSRLDQAA